MASPRARTRPTSSKSLIEPNAKLAEGYEKLGVSPMPPMNLILKPQEFADAKAFILSLKEPAKDAARK